MARHTKFGWWKDQQGKVINAETLTVSLSGGSTVATIYENEVGGSAITNGAITLSSVGFFQYWVDEANYATTQRFRHTFTGGKFQTQTLDDIVIFPGITASSTDTLTNKTLTTPTIGDFTNATHDHADAAGGGNTLLVPTVASFANATHDHADAAGGGNLGAVQATDVTITGSAAATPDANTLTKDHLIGAIALIDGTGVPSYTAETNFTGAITDNGNGNYSCTIDRDFASANYAHLVTTLTDHFGSVTNVVAGSLDILTTNDDGTPTDLTGVSVVLIGAQ